MYTIIWFGVICRVGCLSIIVCCQVEVSATGQSLVQSATDCRVSLHMIKKPQK
jgi:hypothetical protein